jgi:hypothetical protein
MDVFVRTIKDDCELTGSVIAIVESPFYRHRGPGFESEWCQERGVWRTRRVTKNIITDAGDLFYAERSVKTAIPTNFVDGSGDWDGIFELYADNATAPGKANNRSTGFSGGAFVASSQQAPEATYPKINDTGDADNTGDGPDITTYTVVYTKGTLNDTGIDDVFITNPSHGATEAILFHADGLGTLTITTNDSLKIIVNHQFNGV